MFSVEGGMLLTVLPERTGQQTLIATFTTVGEGEDLWLVENNVGGRGWRVRAAGWLATNIFPILRPSVGEC